MPLDYNGGMKHPVFVCAVVVWLGLSASTAALWFGLTVSFNPAIPATLLGFHIDHSSAMFLSMLTVAGTFGLPILMIGLLIYSLKLWIDRKPAPGLCSQCGYDFRGTPQQCPECGTVTNA